METLFDTVEKTTAEQFDAANPQVWYEFERIALQVAGRGHKHYGAKAIFEVIRFRRAIETTDADFKLNNNLTPYYARKFMERHPEYDGFFEIRRSKEDE